MARTFGTMVHKDTKQVLHNVARLGRHYTNGRQTPIRYTGTTEAGEHVELTPTEFRKYTNAIQIGAEWREAGVQRVVVAAEQTSKCKATVTIKSYHKHGPRKGQSWQTVETWAGIVTS